MRILLVLAMMGWGLVWPLSKMLLDYGSPAQIASLRYLLVLVCFVPLMWLWKIPFAVPRAVLLPTLITGVLNALYSYLMYAGMPYGDSGNAGVITEVLSPIIAAFLWSVYKRESLSKSAKIGLMLGLLAGAFLVDVFGSWRSMFSAFYVIYVLASLDWAALMISSRLATEKINAIALNFYTSVMTFVLLCPALFADSSGLGGDFESGVVIESGAFITSLWDKPLVFFALLVVAAVFCTVFATTIFYKALFVLGVVEGGIYALLAPVFALGFAYLLLDEVPRWHTIVGGVLAVGSIYIINILGKKH
ncbi:DMT family transporter [Helicobacter canis]|uniref:Carboxylate/amino acid/amine transporter n=1 Tax=Helicobacter canis TaxID=29419 RepID=A0A377J4L3_9HELI|nr:DMT family transporter [Helicobacter canis]STO96743.1 carboxylate/amino acid/amine transporter [Helicobacter canis]